MKYYIYLLTAFSFLLVTELYGQSQFNLVPVSEVETSQNLVSCTVHQGW